MLGRIGMVLGNASTATEAYANAYRLDPKTAMLRWAMRKR
jgi:cytochrome c-type biogenesis protein CcmH